MEQALDHPSCQACGGTGTEGQGVCTVCKGAGRVALDQAEATIEQWVHWIREQPSVAHGVEVLRSMLGQPKAPAGVALTVPKVKDGPDAGDEGKKDGDQ